MADVSVRSARTADVPEIARIQVETWRIAYASILPAAVLETLSADDAEQAWTIAVATPPTPRHHVLVAQEQDWLVGFAAIGPTDDLEATDPDPDPEATTQIGPLLGEVTARDCWPPPSTTPARTA